jgi:hypothetical protein
MEGLLTVIAAVYGYFVLVDFPDRATKTTLKFLNEAECRFILRRVAADRDDTTPEAFILKEWGRAGLDPKIWGFALLFFCNGTVSYAIAFYLPIVLGQSIGFSVAAAQCLVAPPYAFAGILMWLTSWAADRWKMRAPVLVFNAVISLIGLPVLVSPLENFSVHFADKNSGICSKPCCSILCHLPCDWWCNG